MMYDLAMTKNLKTSVNYTKHISSASDAHVEYLGNPFTDEHVVTVGHVERLDDVSLHFYDAVLIRQLAANLVAVADKIDARQAFINGPADPFEGLPR